MGSIRVGNTDFPIEILKALTLDECKQRFHYLPPKVVEVAYNEVNPKPKRKRKRKKVDSE